MKWKFNQFEFCEKSQILTNGAGNELRLEPKVAEVLAYFCQHPNKIVSKEELIQNLWNGQAVTDNAVTRVIANLRKQLGDDSRSSEYIVTFPKKGYRFIAIPHEQSEECVTGNSHRSSLVVKPVYLLITLLISVMVFWGVFSGVNQNQLLNSQQPINSAKALTRDSGSEYHGAVSPDQQYLIYSASLDNSMLLYIRELASGDTKLIGSENGYSGPAEWSSDGTKIVYLYTDANTCEIRTISIVNFEASDHRTLYHCPSDSYGRVIFNHEGNAVLFSERQSTSTPYSLFKLDLVDGTKTQLPQPIPRLRGNTEFDLHPDEDKLLISSPSEDQQLDIYQLDIEGRQLQKLFTRNDYTCCAIWAHNGDDIILLSGFPATGLISVSKDGKNEKVIYESPMVIGAAKRINNQQDYLFPSIIYDTDITSSTKTAPNRLQILNSSVVEDLPALSPNGETLAYVSSRSGIPQVWTYNFKLNSVNQITRFNKPARYFDLDWSPDGERLMLLSQSDISFIEFATNKVETVPISPQEIRGQSWKNTDIISFSIKSNNEWQAHEFQLSTKSLTLAEGEYSYVAYGDLHNLYFTSDGKVYLNDTEFGMPLRWPNQVNRRFELSLKGNHLHFVNIQGDNSSVAELIHYEIENNKVLSKHVIPDNTSFDSNAETLYFTELVSSQADLYRTH